MEYLFFNIYIYLPNLFLKTWGQASKYDIWPNYIAVEKPIEPVRIFLPNFISEVILIHSHKIESKNP